MDNPPNIGVIESRLASLEREHYRFAEAIANLSGRIDEKFGSLSAQISERSKTNWSTLCTFAGLLITVIGALGGLALLPVYHTLESHGTSIEKQRDVAVPRAELTEKFASVDRDFDNARQNRIMADENLQRQIDDIRRAVNGIYGATDVIKDISDRLKKVEDMNWRATVESSSARRN